MGDIATDSDLDVYIDKTGDLAFATGRAEFDQKIALALNNYYNEVIGENDPDTAIEQLKVGARRAVDYVDLIERLALVDVSFKEDEPNTVEITIMFDSGEALVFDGDDSGITTASRTARVYDDSTQEGEFSFDVYEDGDKV